MTAPAAWISLRVDALRGMLADCPAYRAWIGAASPAAAKAATYAFGFPTGLRGPLMMVDVTNTCTLTRQRTSGPKPCSLTMDLMLYAISPVTPDDLADPAAAGFGHYNAIAAILAELMALPRQPGRLLIQEAIQWGTGRPSEQEAEAQGDYYESAWLLSIQSGAV